MQPKAAKKIGGMTPKKMTGGEFGAAETVEIADYTVTKQIDQESGRMKICVESKMPTGEAPSMVPPNAAAEALEAVDNNANAAAEALEAAAALKARAEAVADKLPNGKTPDNATKEEVEAAEKQQGGKKKRKSSKKRKSMKKKGGMRKSMKVKA